MDPSLIYTYREKEYFDYLFNTYKRPTSDFIEGNEFAVLMRKSNLAKVRRSACHLHNHLFSLTGNPQINLGIFLNKKRKESNQRRILLGM